MTFIQNNECKEIDLISNIYGEGLYDDLSALNIKGIGSGIHASVYDQRDDCVSYH